MTSSALSRLSNLHSHLHPYDSDSKVARFLKVSPEVSQALSCGKAVVALESTIISHGMPYPQNLKTAKEVEEIVRKNGAVPATIAILDGIPCIGLSTEELERLATLGTRAQKTARRDIAHIVAMKGNGATTVSATMFFASMVGISVFVTGGIGGVHRHGEHTMDVSSDLTELGRTPVAVISAGVKSILDIPRTLEYLETQGVCVTSYKSNEFPAFFTETSGCKAPCRVDSPEECALLIDATMKLKLGTGILIAVPIPKEHSASGNSIESAIQRALGEARDKNISGNAETPFLLARVNELTGGASLASNIALVKNNADVGAKIAVALARLREHSDKGAYDQISIIWESAPEPTFLHQFQPGARVHRVARFESQEDQSRLNTSPASQVVQKLQLTPELQNVTGNLSTCLFGTNSLSNARWQRMIVKG